MLIRISKVKVPETQKDVPANLQGNVVDGRIEELALFWQKISAREIRRLL